MVSSAILHTVFVKVFGFWELAMERLLSRSSLTESLLTSMFYIGIDLLEMTVTDPTVQPKGLHPTEATIRI
jgi:hypothetical protein